MGSLQEWRSGQGHSGPRLGSLIGEGKIPNAKKPKSRPPRSLRDKAVVPLRALPYYSGPYSVGLMDIEVPVEKPRTFSKMTRHSQHLLKLETVLMTVFYPSAFGSGSGRDPSGSSKWSRQTWLSRPRVRMAKGYGHFAGMGNLAVPWFASTTMFTKIPAFRNAKPAAHWPPADNSIHGGTKVKNEEGPPPPGGDSVPDFPMMIFSHGLGGNRNCYSSLCGEFASYGFVVCAIEHRDGSGARTYVNHSHSGEGSLDERDRKGEMKHNQRQRKKGYDRIDYIFPKDNPYDTNPNNEKGVDQELRHWQIELRLAEIEEAHRVMCMLCHGQGAEIARKNLRREGYIGASSRGLEGIDWSLWKDRFHCQQVTILGHSFGAATAVEVLRNTERFSWVSQGIIYDVWSAAIKPAENEPRHHIMKPLLGINSEAFMYWQSNYDRVMALMEEAKSKGAPAWLLTVRGTVHISQSDFSILYPILSALLLKMTANPKRAVDLNVSASLEFLRLVMPERKEIIERTMTNEGLLETEVLEDIPTDHRPPAKWIAAKLKIPHEFRNRFLPQVSRKIKRAMEEKQSQEGEVWMHVRTDGDEVERWARSQQNSEQRLEPSDEIGMERDEGGKEEKNGRDRESAGITEQDASYSSSGTGLP